MTPMRLPTARTRLLPLLATLLTALALLAGPVSPATSQDGTTDPRAERERVRSQQADVAAQVDTLQADQSEVTAALAAIDTDLRSKQASLADAQAALTEAEAEVVRLEGERAATEADIEQLRVEVREFSVAAYMSPPDLDGFETTFRAGNANDAAAKQALLSVNANHKADVIDELRAAEATLAALEEDATAARADAAAKRDEADAKVAEVQEARDRQALFVAEVEERLDMKLMEATILADQDQQLSDQIAREEAEIAAALQRMREQEIEAQQAAAPVSPPTAATTTPPTSAGGGSTTTAPTVPGQTTPPTQPPTTTPPTTTPPPVVIPPITGSGEIVSVRGIFVHRSIAGNVEALLAAAQASGVNLSGSGWRDANQQIALRRQNCGTSDYAIWQMPASQCSPPTAIPGRSMHERGLAIDFTYNGGFINSRSNPGYVWLAANAGRFGLINLPSEPWHWSTTGQ